MKNVNLTNIFLNLVKKYDINAFELSSIVPIDSEPIDALIVFKGGNISHSDLDAVNVILKASIEGEIKSIDVKMVGNALQVYLEFNNSEYNDN